MHAAARRPTNTNILAAFMLLVSKTSYSNNACFASAATVHSPGQIVESCRSIHYRADDVAAADEILLLHHRVAQKLMQ